MEYEGRREKMVRTQIEARGVHDPAVLRALRKIQRHRFVPEAFREQAYDDMPLPIGHKQTISQPYTVAVMSEALGLTGKERALEIGTGSGYQSAILAELAEWVYSIERIPELAKSAREVLDQLGYDNVAIRVGDGTRGWKSEAPFDCIIVTAGGPQVPEPLLQQLAEAGRLVIPVGDPYTQSLTRVTHRGREFITENLGAYRFVELIGEYGWEK
jgi:protein-L-isoaspartate(D-aspartate) O-methyltransferase